jgi:hypothetical protein
MEEDMPLLLRFAFAAALAALDFIRRCRWGFAFVVVVDEVDDVVGVIGAPPLPEFVVRQEDNIRLLSEGLAKAGVLLQVMLVIGFVA